MIVYALIIVFIIILVYQMIYGRKMIEGLDNNNDNDVPVKEETQLDKIQKELDRIGKIVDGKEQDPQKKDENGTIVYENLQTQINNLNISLNGATTNGATTATIS